jgi:murein DD-endopeptidase MepM/ murein hydrolase activator NlpD
MRTLAESRSRLLARVAVLALIAAGTAGCSIDTSRFNENPFQSAQAARPGDLAAAPRGRVEAQNLPAPSRPANIAATGASPQPAANTVPTRVASAPAHVTPKAGAPVAAPTAAGAMHKVVPGETLTSIARHYGKSRVEIAKANHIDSYATLRVGQTLTIPGLRPAPQKSASVAKPQPAPQPAVAAVPAKLHSPAKPQAAPQTQVASVPSTPTARVVTQATETPQASAPSGSELTGSVPSFRWPVHGRVIAGYGAKVNGTPNDGINLAVPEGTSVKSAEDGVVAYAGNELKGYGNLVLVRHPNGFVTAYAHASEVLVKRGDQVKRGQILARAGQTGSVTSPQLHFEIRKGATPIDPGQYLAGN